MSTTVEEFEELLNAEVRIDMQKLQEAAKHGIPQQVRGAVWKYLLGVEQPDKSKELSTIKAKSEEYHQFEKVNNDVIRRVRGEVGRYQRRSPLLKDAVFTNTFVIVISTFLNNHRSIDYYPALIPMCGPFVFCIEMESEIYYSFEKFMSNHEDYFTNHTITEQVANFVTLFRATLPELYNYFEEEEVDFKEWTTSWLQYLLTKELPLECVLRLLDTYFSSENGFDLHIYVCLAVLKQMKDTLEELEHSEIMSTLLRLPLLDMDQIINQAVNIRHEIMERQIYDIL